MKKIISYQFSVLPRVITINRFDDSLFGIHVD